MVPHALGAPRGPGAGQARGAVMEEPEAQQRVAGCIPRDLPRPGALRPQQGLPGDGGPAEAASILLHWQGCLQWAVGSPVAVVGCPGGQLLCPSGVCKCGSGRLPHILCSSGTVATLWLQSWEALQWLGAFRYCRGLEAAGRRSDPAARRAFMWTGLANRSTPGRGRGPAAGTHALAIAWAGHSSIRGRGGTGTVALS